MATVVVDAGREGGRRTRRASAAVLALALVLTPALAACRREHRGSAPRDAGAPPRPAATAAAPPPEAPDAGAAPALVPDVGAPGVPDAAAPGVPDAAAPAAKPAEPAKGGARRRPPRPRGRSDCDTTYCDNDGNCWPGRCP